MLCVDSSRLCMSGLSLCDLCLCYSIFGSQFSNKYLLTYLLRYLCDRKSLQLTLRCCRNNCDRGHVAAPWHADVFRSTDPYDPGFKDWLIATAYHRCIGCLHIVTLMTTFTLSLHILLLLLPFANAPLSRITGLFRILGAPPRFGKSCATFRECEVYNTAMRLLW